VVVVVVVGVKVVVVVVASTQVGELASINVDVNPQLPSVKSSYKSSPIHLRPKLIPTVGQVVVVVVGGIVVVVVPIVVVVVLVGAAVVVLVLVLEVEVEVVLVVGIIVVVLVVGVSVVVEVVGNPTISKNIELVQSSVLETNFKEVVLSFIPIIVYPAFI